MICVAISDKQKEKCLQILDKVEMAEIRLDLTQSSLVDIEEIFKHPTPKIATCRFENTSLEEQYLKLKKAIECGAQFVDVELETPESQMDKIIDLAKKIGCKVILSYHNFKETPGLHDLYKIADECYDKGADIAKIATMVKCPEDNGRLMALYSIGRPIVSLGMGEIGKISRITSLMLGAEFTFSSQDDGLKTAPGQIEYSKMKALFEHIRSTTE